MGIFRRRKAIEVTPIEVDEDTVVKIDTSTNNNTVCPCGNPDCPSGLFALDELPPFAGAFIIPALRESEPTFIEVLKARLSDDVREYNETDDVTNAAAPAPAPMVGRDELRKQIETHREEIAHLENLLAIMEVPEDVSDMFAPMVDDPSYSIIGDPVEYSRSEDQLVALAKVIFDGDPYTVIARSTEGVEADVDRHFVYIHLDDDFGFTLANAIYHSRREMGVTA